MTMPQNFRSAFNGFNREDVVHYIEYINARHNAEVKQLKSELDLLQNQQVDIPDVSALEEELAALREERDQLLEKIAQLEEQATAPVATPAATAVSAELELETYRRAERMERIARERAEQVYHQANAALAEATVKVDAAALQISQMSEAVLNQLNGLQQAVNNSKQALADAANTMYTIRPTQE